MELPGSLKKGARDATVVWEITLKCNLACSHCGSRAGEKRADELTTLEALDLVKQMSDLGVVEVTLIGGEAYLRPDWLMIASEITRLGMRATMTTGGYGISIGTAKRMKQAGISSVSVSIDGLEQEHDKMRGKQGSWRQCFKSLEHIRSAGINISCNTQINRKSAKDLPLLYEHLVKAGVTAWQIQLTVPMGNAADNDEMLFQPTELLDLYPLLAVLSQRGRKDNLMIFPGNNIGYFGPYERLLRGHMQLESEWAFFKGCPAGQGAIGIEADGTIKACPSLPTQDYAAGNIRAESLTNIYHNAPKMRFNDINIKEDATKHLWGECAKCEFGATCRAGCSWTSHVFFGKRGNNPYCHHRALKLAAMGQKEKIRKVTNASGNPFDHALFEIEKMPIGDIDPNSDRHFTILKINFPKTWLDEFPNIHELLYTERKLSLLKYIESGVVSKSESSLKNTYKEAV